MKSSPHLPHRPLQAPQTKSLRSRPCRDAAINSGTWWLNVVGNDPDLAEKTMQSCQTNRDACLKGAPHFDSWLKKVKAEQASEYTVKTNGSKPPHSGCLEIADIEAPSGAPHQWTCYK